MTDLWREGNLDTHAIAARGVESAAEGAEGGGLCGGHVVLRLPPLQRPEGQVLQAHTGAMSLCVSE